LCAVLLVAGATGAGEEAAMAVTAERQAARPAIDLAVPARTERAVFALG
jgi:hypothetical protein